MNKDNNLTHGDIPLGLGMAFAQNVDAMKRFSEMSDAERQAVIEKAHSVQSKQEMRAFVASIASQSMN